MRQPRLAYLVAVMIFLSPAAYAEPKAKNAGAGEARAAA
jgi:hypothetical protein